MVYYTRLPVDSNSLSFNPYTTMNIGRAIRRRQISTATRKDETGGCAGTRNIRPSLPEGVDQANRGAENLDNWSLIFDDDCGTIGFGKSYTVWRSYWRGSRIIRRRTSGPVPTIMKCQWSWKAGLKAESDRRAWGRRIIPGRNSSQLGS